MIRRLGALVPLLLPGCAPAPAPAPAPPFVSVPPPHTAPSPPPQAPPLPAPVLAPVSVDVAALPAPPERWSVPAGRAPAARLADHGVVALLPGDAGAQLLDADTGKLRWKRAAAHGERWLALAAGTQDGAPYVAALGAGARDARFLIRLDPRTGKLLEHRRVTTRTELERGEHGGLELVDRERCEASILDASTGKALGPPLPGTKKELRDFKGRPVIECNNTVALHELGAGVATASVLRGGAASLLTISAAGTLRDRVLAGQVVDLLDQGDHRSLYAGMAVARSARGELLGVDPATGDVAFTRTLPAATACSDPVRVRAVPGPPDHPRAALLQACGDVELVDADSGATVWTAHVAGVAVIDGEPARRIPSAAASAVEWLSPAGASMGRMALPDGTTEIEPLGAGLLVVLGQRSVVLAAERDARVRWQYRVEWSRLAVVDDRVVLVSGTHRLFIDPGSGTLVAAAAPAPWTVGRAAGDASLWVDQGASPDTVRALGLPPTLEAR